MLCIYVKSKIIDQDLKATRSNAKATIKTKQDDTEISRVSQHIGHKIIHLLHNQLCRLDRILYSCLIVRVQTIIT